MTVSSTYTKVFTIERAPRYKAGIHVSTDGRLAVSSPNNIFIWSLKVWITKFATTSLLVCYVRQRAVRGFARARSYHSANSSRARWHCRTWIWERDPLQFGFLVPVGAGSLGWMHSRYIISFERIPPLRNVLDLEALHVYRL